MDILSSGNAPFLVALLLLLTIGVLEMLAVLLGASLSGHIDAAIDTHPDITLGENIFAHSLSWLHIGRLPFLVILVLFLGGFSLSGLVLQWLAGGGLPVWLATIGAFMIGVFCVRWCGRGIARYLPRDESNAVSTDSFVGRMATMTGATAKAGSPAEARLADQHGRSHYILIEPDEAGVSFTRGEKVLVTARISGSRFSGSTNPWPDLL
ncbi:YqiJ family protein [Serratia sp. L9]|uniref:YqiJ family protein n=1 Tax=Serratia sp. L9 TaxID=3423946 RepID=UPI003D66EC3E